MSQDSLTRRGFIAGVAGLAALSGCKAGTEREDSPGLTAPSTSDDAAWASIRDRFILKPDIAYLNNASLGMPPRDVVEAVHAGYKAISEEPLHGKHDLQAAIAEVVIPGLAGLLGVAGDEISLTRNATEALHLQAVGVTLQRGDEVIITTQEHPAGQRPWLFRQSREGISVKEVFVPSPLPPDDDLVGLIESAITGRTKAIAFCHVTRGGHLYPVQKLCQMANARNVVSLVDGAQAIGQFPIDVAALGCDAYSASLHKWLLGPAGTGVMVVRQGARDRIRTSFAHDADASSPALAPPGTADFPVRAALAAALSFVNEMGLDRVESRCRYLSDHLKDRLAESKRVTLLSGARERSVPGNTIFEVEGLDAVEAVGMIEQTASAHIDEHQRDGHNAIRISTHVYNTVDEIDRVVEALIT